LQSQCALLEDSASEVAAVYCREMLQTGRGWGSVTATSDFKNFSCGRLQVSES